MTTTQHDKDLWNIIQLVAHRKTLDESQNILRNNLPTDNIYKFFKTMTSEDITATGPACINIIINYASACFYLSLDKNLEKKLRETLRAVAHAAIASLEDDVDKIENIKKRIKIYYIAAESSYEIDCGLQYGGTIPKGLDLLYPLNCYSSIFNSMTRNFAKDNKQCVKQMVISGDILIKMIIQSDLMTDYGSDINDIVGEYLEKEWYWKTMKGAIIKLDKVINA